MTSTNAPAPRAGTWITMDACEQKIVLRKGDQFPQCPPCRQQTFRVSIKTAE
jgi:hypothetical protein